MRKSLDLFTCFSAVVLLSACATGPHLSNRNNERIDSRSPASSNPCFLLKADFERTEAVAFLDSRLSLVSCLPLEDIDPVNGFCSDIYYGKAYSQNDFFLIRDKSKKVSVGVSCQRIKPGSVFKMVSWIGGKRFEQLFELKEQAVQGLTIVRGSETE